MKKYIVRLSDKERAKLRELVNKGRAAAYKRKHAQILLKADIAEDVGLAGPINVLQKHTAWAYEQWNV